MSILEARDSIERRRVLSGAALLLVAGLAGAQAVSALPLERPGIEAALLAAGAAAGGYAASRIGRAARLDLVFVITAFLLLPAPWAALLALLGHALGAWRRGPGEAARSDLPLAWPLLAVSLAQIGAEAMGLPGAPAATLTVLAAAALAAVVRGVELAAALALLVPLPDPRQMRRRACTDGLQVLAACVLAHEIAAGRVAGSLALILSLLATASLAAALARARAEARREIGRVARSRLELDTLHAFGREVLASLDTNHVLGVLDREARKVVEADVVVVALADPGRSRVREVYRRKGDGPAHRAQVDLHDPVTRWTVEELRGRRIDELPPARPAGPGVLLDHEARSALVAPMLVEGRLLGLVAVQSRETRAYDEQHLALLTTMAQQAAAAIDNARHHRLATIDSLTGFYLRDYFFRWLEEEQQRLRRYGGSLAALMIDLDGFKSVNDDHGHMAGDRYLADIAQVVRLELRSADVACRLGGDEFCVMLPETDLAGARIIAERIRNAVSRRVVAVDGVALRTTVSIGLAAYPEQATRDLAELVRLADEALYRAKREGRDRVAPWAA